MSNHIEEILLQLKKYCSGFEDCDECELFGKYGCYLNEKAPEEYFEESECEINE